MSTERPPLDPAALRAVCAYAMAHVILPDDVVRVCVGLRPKEPFVIDATRIAPSRHRGRRFLSILAELHRGDAAKFQAAVTKVRGRLRTYFGRTQEEVESTGNSNNAAQIPGTDWWASINNSEFKRSEIVNSAMTQMGFSYDYCRMVSRLCFRPVAELPSHYVRVLSKT